MGLREKKKNYWRQRILTAAIDQFSTKGYKNTTIKSIAESAEIALGTVYNYYEHKEELLLARLALDFKEMLSSGNTFLESRPSDPTEAISSLLVIYFKTLTDRIDRDLLREVLNSRQNENLTFNKEGFRLDLQVMDQISHLFERFQDEGKCKKDINAWEASGLIYGVLMVSLTLYVALNYSVQSTIKLIRRNMKLMFNGFAIH